MKKGKKIHWSKWKHVCFPTEEGGLGIRSFCDMCKAFSIKLWIRFREQSTLWAHCMFVKYCKDSCPRLIDKNHSDSLIWKRMMSVTQVA